MFDAEQAIGFMVGAHNAHQSDRDQRKAIGMPVLPKAGMLDARGFMLAIRKAGRRLNADGKLYTNESEVRNDMIRAIAGYVGYDLGANYGPQELVAKTKAHRELSGKPVTGMTLAEKREASRSMVGFVAGMPDAIAKQVGDLRGRETKLAEDMLAASKAGNASEAQRLYALLGNTRDEISRIIAQR
jgi:hypothetical protein